jgi:hypothetical protein
MANALSNIDVRVQPNAKVIEPNALKTIIRQQWEGKFEGIEKSRSKQIMIDLEEHVSNMQSILNTMDYEVFCVTNIITNSKHMTRDDLVKYLSVLEAIGTGYSHMLNKDLATLVMIGITARFRTLNGLTKHYHALMGRIEAKSCYYNDKMFIASKAVDSLSTELKTQESSLLRFFFRGRINSIRGKLNSKSSRVKKLESKVTKYRGLSEKVRRRFI